jgi:hypothetical protein
MSHTKLPWKVVKTALNAISVKNRVGLHVCEIINDDAATLTPLMEDNAAFIARAANCHEELLSGCKEALRLIRNQTGNWQLGTKDMLERAIAKAEGKN